MRGDDEAVALYTDVLGEVVYACVDVPIAVQIGMVDLYQSVKVDLRILLVPVES